MSTVITYGTFDLFHIGHLRLIKRLKEISNNGRVIVAVSSDEFNEIKGKRTIIPYAQRAEIVEAIGYVDKVIREDSWEQKVEDIRRYDVDIFAIGEDWSGKFDKLKKVCDVKYLPRTQGVSSRDLKISLKNIQSIKPEDIIKTMEVLKLLSIDLK